MEPMQERHETALAVSADHDDDGYDVPIARNRSNTLVAPLRTVASWKADDLCFDFGDAFVRPESRQAFADLAGVRQRHADAPIALFGHADPVGRETSNQRLSERRAHSVYALLIRDAQAWLKLHSVRRMQVVLAALDFEPGPIDDVAGHRTSSAVLRYMDWLCGDLVLEKSDFLNAGASAFQGCSEFNPIRIFSKDLQQNYDDNELGEERNDANAPNRRIVAFFFDPATVLPADRWPCPTAADGVSGCRAQFWPDAQTRMAQGSHNRQRTTDGPQEQADQELSSDAFVVLQPPEAGGSFVAAEDTFACKFYERVALRSPCEFVQDRFRLDLTLPDPVQTDCVPEAVYKVVAGGEECVGLTDGRVVSLSLPGNTEAYTVQWRDVTEDIQETDVEYPFQIEVRMDRSNSVEGIAVTLLQGDE